jgi:flagellar biosynthesis protein FlhF
MNSNVQTFRGADSAAALAAARKALGPDAVVLDTRSVPGTLLRKPQVEVVAGIGPSAVPDLDDRSGRPSPRGPAPGAPRASRPAGDDVSAEMRRLLSDIGEVRESLGGLARETRTARELGLPPAVAQAYSRLVDRGVEPSLAEELVRQVSADNSLAGIPQGVHDQVESFVLPCRAPWLHGERQVVALVGPTGVGKTTTLAKIAARAILETRKRVALLTVDVYRIGAREQLAKYGEIMNVPVLVARDRAELGRVAERVRDVDLVLVDTAGRSSPDDVGRQAELVRSLPGVVLHLVVSAAAGHQQLAAVAEAYRSLRPDRIIFTKVDEAAGPGALLSAATRLRRPVACIANGQNVPEDIHATTGRQLADLIAGPMEDRSAPRER